MSKSSWLALCFVALAAAGCGKKGPPLAPVMRIPAGIDMITAQRSGSDVYVTLTVPAKNVDNSMPVHISRIEVYGYTGRVPPPRTRWAEFGDLIATIPVTPPPEPTAPPQPPPDPAKGAVAGQMITVYDQLTAQKLVQGRVDTTPVQTRGRQRTPLTPIADVAPVSNVLHRYYIAFAFSEKGIPGPPSADADLPLFEAPDPPAFVHAAYTDAAVSVDWPPSAGIIGFLFNRQLPPEDPPLDERTLEPIVVPTAPVAAGVGVVQPPTGPVHYNVYREQEPDPLGPLDETPATPWTVAPRKPINPAPLDAMTITDPVELGRERCYTVRAVRGVAPNAVESDASAPECFVPVDVFPPAPPQGLVAVADEGGISLIWQPNAEPDIGGYLVLRGEAPGATLQPLTPTPVVEPRFRDTHVMSGKKYVYAVLAVDSHLPVANISGESMRAEETAR